jgi:hypothetical protein
MLKLEERDSCKLLGLPWEGSLDVGLHSVAQEKQPVLVSDSLEILELSVGCVLEAL